MFRPASPQHPGVHRHPRDDLVIKEKLHSALRRFDLDLIIAENCLTIPMNIPLGLAVVETVMETGIGCIAHHHDFYWERERFPRQRGGRLSACRVSAALPQIHHVVINSQAAREFSRRRSAVPHDSQRDGFRRSAAAARLDCRGFSQVDRPGAGGHHGLAGRRASWRERGSNTRSS